MQGPATPRLGSSCSLSCHEHFLHEPGKCSMQRGFASHDSYKQGLHMLHWKKALNPLQVSRTRRIAGKASFIHQAAKSLSNAMICRLALSILQRLPSGKLAWNLTRAPFKTMAIYTGPLFRFHLSFLSKKINPFSLAGGPAAQADLLVMDREPSSVSSSVLFKSLDAQFTRSVHLVSRCRSYAKLHNPQLNWPGPT